MKAKLIAPTSSNLVQAAAALKAGQVVAMPTETVYGLAGNAFDPSALARIFSTKERPTFDPLIVHLSPGILPGWPGLESLESAGIVDPSQLSTSARDRADRLIRAFWPGPLTLVLPKTSRIPDLATSGLPTVGLRMPRHPVAQALIERAGVPLAAPSANRFGRISPTTAQAVEDELGDRIEWILDGGPCEVGLESTIVGVDLDGTLRLLRPGGLPVEELEANAGTSIHAWAAHHTGAALAAPGLLESHYAPTKPLRLLSRDAASVSAEEFSRLLQQLPPGKPFGVLLLKGPIEPATTRISALTGRLAIVRSLSVQGDLSEAAQNLFAAMRELDGSDAEILLAEPCTETRGLGHAITDRLRRASAG